MELVTSIIVALLLVWGVIYYIRLPLEDVVYICKYCKRARPLHTLECPRSHVKNRPTQEY